MASVGPIAGAGQDEVGDQVGGTLLFKVLPGENAAMTSNTACTSPVVSGEW
jgi:hypothetical protein